MKIKNILFIGSGCMGKPMIINLLKKGYNVSVFNRTIRKASPLQKYGANICFKLPMKIKEELIIIMVKDDEAIDEFFFGKYDLLSKIVKSSIILQTSTISFEKSLQLNNVLTEKEIYFLDSPVSGAIPSAENGNLDFFLSGKENITKIVYPVLESMGKRVYFLGKAGNGTLMKLTNNMLNGIQIASLIEAFTLAKGMNLNIENFCEIISNGSPGSPIVKNKMKFIQDENSEKIESYLELLEKDLSYCMQLINKVKSFDILKTTYKVFDKAVSKGLGKEDVASIYKLIN